MLKTKVDVHPSSSSSSSSSSYSPSPSVSASSSSSFVETKTWTVSGGGLDGNSDLRNQLREEIKHRLGSSTHSSPLSGAAAIMQERKLNNTTRPDLLGCGDDFQYTETVSNKIYDLFTASELDGRFLHSLIFHKRLDLGVSVEGGLGSPLNGRVLVAMIFDDGMAKKSGKMRVGDQLMAVNGVKLVDVTVTKANTILQDVASSDGTQEFLELVFCPSVLVNEEESMTYF